MKIKSPTPTPKTRMVSLVSPSFSSGKFIVFPSALGKTEPADYSCAECFHGFPPATSGITIKYTMHTEETGFVNQARRPAYPEQPQWPPERPKE